MAFQSIPSVRNQVSGWVAGYTTAINHVMALLDFAKPCTFDDLYSHLVQTCAQPGNVGLGLEEVLQEARCMPLWGQVRYYYHEGVLEHKYGESLSTAPKK